MSSRVDFDLQYCRDRRAGLFLRLVDQVIVGTAGHFDAIEYGLARNDGLLLCAGYTPNLHPDKDDALFAMSDIMQEYEYSKKPCVTAYIRTTVRPKDEVL